MIIPRSSLIILALTLAALSACSDSSDTTAKGDAGDEARDAGDDTESDASACPEPPKSDGGLGSILETDLPKGTCAGQDSCSYTVYRTCPCDVHRYDGFTCTCTSGGWSCEDTLPAQTYCGCLPDAGSP